MKTGPSLYEKFAARIVSEYFDTEVGFIRRSNISKSADLLINDTTWEIKSPIGNSKRTMQNNLRLADNQSPNIIINLVRCKMKPEIAIHRLKHELKKGANNKNRLFSTSYSPDNKLKKILILNLCV